MREDDDTLASSARWHVVYVRSRHEFMVRDTLNKTGIDIFLPTVNKPRLWKDRRKIVCFPLFPGYLFVRADERDRRLIGRIMEMRGVVSFLLGPNGSLGVVPDDQVDCLRKMVGANPSVLDAGIVRGRKVRLIRGPLSGMEGVLIERRQKRFFVVSIDIIQRGVCMTVAAEDVEFL